MWGRKDVDRRPELERLAASVERLFLAMPAADQQSALAAVSAMARVGAELRVIPDALAAELGKVILRVIAELNMPLRRKPSPHALALQVVAGAPILLGPHQAEIQILLGDS